MNVEPKNPQQKPILSVRKLYKKFGKLEVLKGVDLDIYKGDTIAIIGPSGCGKSTFLRCLNFLEMPTAGEILFKDEIIYKNERVYLKRKMKKLLALKKTNAFDTAAQEEYAALEKE